MLLVLPLLAFTSPARADLPQEVTDAINYIVNGNPPQLDPYLLWLSAGPTGLYYKISVTISQNADGSIEFTSTCELVHVGDYDQDEA